MTFQQSKEISSLIDDLSNCQICFNPFGSKECCPRMLSCGHTFCHSCLQRFISEGSVCPTCKEGFHFISADNIQINFSVKSFSENLTNTKDPNKVMADTKPAAASTNSKESLAAKKVSKLNELPFEGHCEEHFSPNHFKCLDCNQYICGTCVVLVHNDCTKPLPVLEAFNFIKKGKLEKILVFKTKLEKEVNHLNRKQEKLNQEIKIVKAEVKRNQKLYEDSSVHEESLEKATSNEDFDKVVAKVNVFFEENFVDVSLPIFSLSAPSILSKEDAIKLTRKDLEENTFYVTKSDNEGKKYAKVKVEDNQISFDEWEEEAEEGSSCIDLLDFICSKNSVIDTHKFIEERKTELYNPKLPKDKIKFSEIAVKDRSVYFYSFETNVQSDFVFKFGSLLKTLGCSSVVPAEAFLRHTNSLESEVVITTDGRSPRALNFLLLASGIMDDSYKQTIFSSSDSSVEGGFINRLESGHYRHNFFSGVVEGIQDGRVYRRNESKRGDVQGCSAEQSDYLSSFKVWTKDDSAPSKLTFGRVKKGLEALDWIHNGDSVKEFGLLFDLF